MASDRSNDYGYPLNDTPTAPERHPPPLPEFTPYIRPSFGRDCVPSDGRADPNAANDNQAYPEYYEGSYSHYGPSTPSPQYFHTIDESAVRGAERPPAPSHSQHSKQSHGSAPDAYPQAETSSRFPTDGPRPSSNERGEPAETWTGRQNQGTIKRYTKKKKKLVQMSVSSVEYPVPSAIQNAIQPHYRSDPKAGREFTQMRYTAATCDPDDFTPRNRYNLRPAMYNRHTELLIAITYYNEDKVMTARTLHSVMQNIGDIVALQKSEFWNREGPAWQKIVVCLIFDGIEPCDKDTLDILATLGVYQDGIMRKDIDGRDTVAHIFEYTTQLSITPDQELVRPKAKDDDATALPPVQIIFCLKQKNCKKINSHRWLFNAFGRILNPEVCVLLDAGAKLSPKSLLTLWEAFYNDRELGGAFGETYVMLKGGWKNLLNPLIAAQNFEYKISSLLDRPFESCFGYLSMSHESLSAYRFRAIMGRPLEQYFHGDHTLSARLGRKGIMGMNIFQKNMFLVADRILGFELATKAGAKWHIAYFREAKCEMDIPESSAELLGQRRRWLNGSFAASIHSITHFPRIYRTGHSIIQIFLFHIRMLCTTISITLFWFSLSAFFLATKFTMDIAGTSRGQNMHDGWPFGNKATPIINTIVLYIYLGFLLLQFLLAFGNRPLGFKLAYRLSFVVFGSIQFYVLVLWIYLVYDAFATATPSRITMNQGASTFWKTLINSDAGGMIVITSVATFGLHFIASLMYRDPWHIISSSFQYFLVMPSFINILMVYAFSNWHDVTWGVRGPDRADVLPTARFLEDAEEGRRNTTVVDYIENNEMDINNQFEQTVRRALAPYSPIVEKEMYSPEDTYKNSRTCLIAAWIFSNVLLSVSIIRDSANSIGFTVSSVCPSLGSIC